MRPCFMNIFLRFLLSLQWERWCSIRRVCERCTEPLSSGAGSIIVSPSVEPELDFLTPVIIIFTVTTLTTAAPPEKKQIKAFFVSFLPISLCRVTLLHTTPDDVNYVPCYTFTGELQRSYWKPASRWATGRIAADGIIHPASVSNSIKSFPFNDFIFTFDVDVTLRTKLMVTNLREK